MARRRGRRGSGWTKKKKPTVKQDEAVEAQESTETERNNNHNNNTANAEVGCSSSSGGNDEKAEDKKTAGSSTKRGRSPDDKGKDKNNCESPESSRTSDADESSGSDEPPPKKRLKQEHQQRRSSGTDKHNPPPILIAIHLGAGEHSMKRKDAYKALCTKACDEAKLILLRGGSASDAVVAATVILEDSGIVNAGSGSSLTIGRKVECDAAFMNGTGYFGGVGAVPGIRNPILVAKKIADMHEEMPVLSCGRVPPTLLTGKGARDWAVANGISMSEDSALISKMASKSYDKYMNMLASKSTSLPQEVCDTVGAVAIDKEGNVAATVSSGGNWLKQSGRIGHAPLFGCGIWASKIIVDDNPVNIAVSCSGAGEMLSKVQLPQKLASFVARESYSGLAAAMSSVIKEEFIDSKALKVHQEVKNVGLVGLVWDGARLEVAWGHSSLNFIVAFNGTGVKNTQMSFSSFTEQDKVGKSANVTGIIV